MIGNVDPIKLLVSAYQNVKSYGSSTAIICTLQQNQIAICNLGDSGFMHIKFQNNIPYILQQSEQQQHDFNVPYQLARVPSKLPNRNKFNSNEFNTSSAFCMDSPEDADYFILAAITQGDLLILASDGVLDNLYGYEILQIIQNHCECLNKINPKELANEIGMEAYRKSKVLSDISTPFNDRLEKCSHIIYDGGKEDDICVIVALLT